MGIRVIVDSSTDCNENIKDRLIVVPTTIIFDGVEYKDGVNLSHKEFYEKLIASDVLPTTSQASPAEFAKVYEEVTGAGDCAIVLTVSSNLSGTYQSAVIASEDYRENVYIIDTQTAAIGEGILAELALKLVDSGMDVRSVVARLEQEKANISVIAVMDTLEYAKRGGRVSKTVAFAGEILKIKPVVSVIDGKIEIIGKARGLRQGNKLVVQEIKKAGGVDFDKPVLLGYTGLSDVLLQKFIEDSKSLWESGTNELHTTIMGGAIGTHAGPGAVAAAFFKK